jgi:membrane-bound lytic murein transglycosylase B
MGIMDRRTFLLSTFGLSATPEPSRWAPAPFGASAPIAPADPFEAWKLTFVDKAAAAGWPRDRVGEVLAPLVVDERVVSADRRQPELSRPVGDYIQGVASTARADEGRTRRAAMASTLERISSRTGVPPEILVSIWAVESNFGAIQGNYDVIRSLATLAADGRRRDWAETQLLAAFRMLFTAEAPRDRLKGSWAGAMGQTQFMPDTFLAFAIDEDGDGQRDIWGSSADALGSAGNYLAKRGAWRRGQGWAREVLLPPGFDYSVVEGPGKTWAAWAADGVRTADGYAWNAAESAEAATLLAPAGWSGPAFLVLPNHMAIRAYNNSTSYALAVGLLADRIAGAPALSKAWPSDQPLTLADRIAAQEALARLGFDPGAADGVIGSRTRAAARAWQQSRGMPADGYLSYGLIQALKMQAGVTTTGTVPAL